MANQSQMKTKAMVEPKPQVEEAECREGGAEMPEENY